MILYNSADILRYLYGLYAHDPERADFLRPTQEALEWEKKIDKMGVNIRRYAYYHILVKSPKGEATALKAWGEFVNNKTYISQTLGQRLIGQRYYQLKSVQSVFIPRYTHWFPLGGKNIQRHFSTI